jgi:integrase
VTTLIEWYRDGADVAARMPLLSAYLGHSKPASTYWYLQAAPELLAWPPAGSNTPASTAMSALAPTIEAFFTQRLVAQRDASPHTIAAYRDTLRLLLAFTYDRTGIPPSRLDIGDVDAALIGAFLTHLETVRGNSVRTRNARLAAIRSLFGYAALRHPEHAELIQRVLAIPTKRTTRPDVCFLTPTEIDALLAAPDPTPGSAAATTPCWSCSSKPACASPN